MPLDTPSKRRSSVGVLASWILAPPSPTDSPGVIDAPDRQHAARTYSGTPASAASPFNVGVLFAAPVAFWTIAAETHGATHANLRVQTYDNATPRRRLRSGPISVHPSSFLVTIPWLQAQSGLAVINSAHPAPGPLANQGFSFTTAAQVWSIPGAAHAYGTANLIVDVYDNATPRNLLPDADVTIHQSTFDVTVTHLQAQTGLVVLCAAGTLGTPNSGTTFTGQLSVTLAGTTFPWRGVQVYDTAGVEVLPGRVTLSSTATYGVVVELLQAQSGTVVLNESGAVAGTIQGSFSQTQDAQTLSGTGALALKATLGATQDAQTLSSTGTLALKATLAATQSAQTLSSAGALALKATVAATQVDQALSSTGIHTALSGTLATTAASDGLASTGALAVKATLNAAQDAQTLSGTGVHPALSGTLTATAGADSLNSAGILALKATLSQTQASQVLAATGALSLQATLNHTQASQALAATGIHPPLSGTLAVSAASQTLAAAGALAVHATVALDQAPQTIFALSQAAGTGLLQVTQIAQTLTSTAALALRATAPLVQAPQTLAATGARPALTGTFTQDQASQTLNASGSGTPLTGTVSLAQDGQTLTASGTTTGNVPVQGSATLAQASQGVVASGTLAAMLMPELRRFFDHYTRMRRGR